LKFANFFAEVTNSRSMGHDIMQGRNMQMYMKSNFNFYSPVCFTQLLEMITKISVY